MEDKKTKGTFYANVYRKESSGEIYTVYGYLHPRLADESLYDTSTIGRISRVKVSWEEGQFDE